MNALEAAVHLQQAARTDHAVTAWSIEHDAIHGVDLSPCAYYQRRSAALYAAAREAYTLARYANMYDGFGVFPTQSRLVQ